MDVFRRIVFSACLAGLVSGLVLTGAQSFFVLPIIAEAESYEHATDSSVSSAKNAVSAHGEAAHSHSRLAWTAISNVGLGIGF
ncbi:MAG TPA: CbtA family protein, partial [Arenicellales bacterium]|nr:CbtA family protein [Arenicellales bacterium]